METEKEFWILVPMKSDESKQAFKDFIKQRTQKDIALPKQYKEGLIMLMVTPDLEKFKLINSVCAASADIKMKDVEDFIEKYDEIKRRYDSTKRETKVGFVNCSMINTGARRPKGFLSRRKASGCHYCLGMPDGSMLGLYVCDGENKRNKIKNFINHWIDVTGKDPVMYGHKISKDKCPSCGGEIHYKNGHSWCIDCKRIFK